MERKRVLLIFNPVAGKGEFALNLFEIVDRFTKNGFEVTLYPTACARDAYEIALTRAEAFDYLVCSGGDGTLNEVVDALMQLEKRPPLGYIPSGTTNDFAYTHGLRTDAFLGVKTVLEGTPVEIDVGCLQDEFFTYVAAFGLFTDVSYGTPQDMKNMLGHAAYLLEGVKKLASIRRFRCKIELPGETLEGSFILGMMLNAKSVGGFRLPEGMDIQLDDGLFELILIRAPRRFAQLQEIVSVLMGIGTPSSSFIFRSASRARILCTEPLAWSVDGEFGGEFSETEITVHRRAISLITDQSSN